MPFVDDNEQIDVAPRIGCAAAERTGEDRRDDPHIARELRDRRIEPALARRRELDRDRVDHRLIVARKCVTVWLHVTDW